MAIVFVARSVKLGRWGSDVGLGKQIYKIGVSEDDPKLLAATGWAGESDWTVLRKQEAGALTEAEIIARLGRKEKIVDPALYPKLKGAVGIVRVGPGHVENSMIVARAMAGEANVAVKVKPSDIADYLIQAATR